jgi:hypothetical protein
VVCDDEQVLFMFKNIYIRTRLLQYIWIILSVFNQEHQDKVLDATKVASPDTSPHNTKKKKR